MSFTVFPAIDLRQGQVVRLKEGDPQRQTQYSADPARVARRWLEAGSRWLHVVNLDGAFDQPDQANHQALRQICTVAAEFSAQVQFGGGLRSLAAVQTALDLGIQRVVLGTAAVEQPELFRQALQTWGPERIAAGLDARDGKVRVRGWQTTSDLSAAEIAQEFRANGLRWLIFTDIARDGLQTGLNLAETARLAQDTGLNVIASGGVATLADVIAVRAAGLPGVIVGRALYENAIEPQALFLENRI